MAGAFFVVYFFFFLLTFKPQDNIKMAGTTPYCDLSVVKEAQLVTYSKLNEIAKGCCLHIDTTSKLI